MRHELVAWWQRLVTGTASVEGSFRCGRSLQVVGVLTGVGGVTGVGGCGRGKLACTGSPCLGAECAGGGGVVDAAGRLVAGLAVCAGDAGAFAAAVGAAVRRCLAL